MITTAKGKELRRKENVAAQVRDEEYQEKLKFDKEKLELKLLREENSRRTSEKAERERTAKTQRQRETAKAGNH